jgi:purine-nucleoside phosphorylase
LAAANRKTAGAQVNDQDRLGHAVESIRDKLGNIQAGTLGLVLGSGLGAVADAFADRRDLPYAAITGMPRAGVDGHEGFLRAGQLAGRPVLAFCGRLHLYEGHAPATVALPVRILHALGVRTLALTNAAGALNPDFEAGGLMLIADHINMTGQSPLTGDNDDRLGPRFPDMGRVWCPRLIALAQAKAKALGMVCRRGVYIQVPGPQLETPAETRAYRLLGADAIGMSTVMEAIAARHLSMRLLGVCSLTNKNDPDDMREITHAGVLEMAARSACGMAALLAAIAADAALDSDDGRE